MSKKSVDTNFLPKITRNDRFVQMSYQEKLIEQKKKEIQAKLEAKEKTATKADSKIKLDPAVKTNPKSPELNTSAQKEVKNIFSNDGSFLNQFKQLKEAKKHDSKFKPFNRCKGRHEKSSSDERNKSDRWAPHNRSASPNDRQQKRISRFDKLSNFEPKITISTSFSSTLAQAKTQEPPRTNYEIPSINSNTQDVVGQPLLKNFLPQQTVTFQSISEPATINESVSTVISASPILLNVPPPQIVQGSNTIVLNQATATQNVLVSAPILTTVNLPPPLVTANITPVPPPCLPTVELASIPPPNPIQIQNIPQPEPLNALNIPQPAPIQVQNIPTPTSLQLNKIPTPKPLDLLSIPTPCENGSISAADFLKNIPPPNKSVPPPLLQENQIILPQSQTVTATLTVPSTQNVLIHNLPPPNSLELIQPAFSSVTVALPVVVGQVSTASALSSNIPSLMAQPILPPPNMINVNVSCPPPLFNSAQVQTFVSQPPPVTNHMPIMNIPPPANVQLLGPIQDIEDMNTVFPPGSSEYEAMTSLGRMVAECGDAFEDVISQCKEQDPRLWFIFDKNSTAYKLYRQYVEQVKSEMKVFQAAKIKSEDIYEPEMALEDTDSVNLKEERDVKMENLEEDNSEKRRKRKSRWGVKEENIPPPSVMYTPPIGSLPNLPITPIPHQGPVILSKITRTDPGLIQYAINTYGTTSLSEEDWKKAEDNYKVSLLYQDMVKKREEAEKLKMAGKNKYEYDSDEETEGGTWEHKAREKEMSTTEFWAQELTKHAEGKHHIGDFLPPDEFQKFMEKSCALKERRPPNLSDYKEFEIKEDNIGFKMLQKLGWSEGEGLGSGGTGIVEPVNKGPAREHTQGLGLNESQDDEDEYQSYRKRMMLAYRFRPNPLNNPRRPYY